ncbi:hypothetical protein TSUD_396590 [Trifolium subterraneum]|uniref:Reverse transcriptase zinc-binding domain-containing protein n=1 Tax=Trifolium subterraneum TaxID=3900 RepID=A0A2Z6N2I3_TRISU|nr:hypothetical protein TSUD_396590 [Trifolium subterraneum]
MLVDKSGLWYRTLVARYREEAGRVLEGGRRGSSWWREIVRIRDGEGVEGGTGWFAQGIERKDEYSGGDECIRVGVKLGCGVANYYWVWRPDLSGGYSVQGTYDLLTSMGGQAMAATTDLIWHKLVPLKVSVAAWRLLRNRLPTKDNLVRRHIISQGAHLCVDGCGAPETAKHLFLSCPVFAPLWGLVRNWIGIS